jgi:hypothetical protein
VRMGEVICPTSESFGPLVRPECGKQALMCCLWPACTSAGCLWSLLASVWRLNALNCGERRGPTESTFRGGGVCTYSTVKTKRWQVCRLTGAPGLPSSARLTNGSVRGPLVLQIQSPARDIAHPSRPAAAVATFSLPYEGGAGGASCGGGGELSNGAGYHRMLLLELTDGKVGECLETHRRWCMWEGLR